MYALSVAGNVFPYLDVLVCGLPLGTTDGWWLLVVHHFQKPSKLAPPPPRLKLHDYPLMQHTLLKFRQECRISIILKLKAGNGVTGVRGMGLGETNWVRLGQRLCT